MRRQAVELFRTSKWIEEDCCVKGCYDGLIFTREGVMRCPACPRALDKYGSGLKIAHHYLPKWSDTELQARLRDREKVVLDREFRLMRGQEMLKQINDIFSGNGNGNGNGKAEEEEEIYNEQDEIPF